MNHPIRKSIFNDQTFYVVIVSVLGILISLNSYNFLAYNNLLALVPVIIQVPILILVLTKHRYAKTGIELWAILLIVGSGLSVFGKLIKMFLGDLNEIESLITKVIYVLVGLAIYHFNNKTVEVKIVAE
ncbi:MAG: hypothetical protein QNJ57_10460 [Flavobacteriaceae bacterium]|nr:hypothetical protein [Flavobacteriaceae bacterium]